MNSLEGPPEAPNTGQIAILMLNLLIRKISTCMNNGCVPNGAITSWERNVCSSTAPHKEFTYCFLSNFPHLQNISVTLRISKHVSPKEKRVFPIQLAAKNHTIKVYQEGRCITQKFSKTQQGSKRKERGDILQKKLGHWDCLWKRISPSFKHMQYSTHTHLFH